MQYDGRRCDFCGDLIDVFENPGEKAHSDCELEEKMRVPPESKPRRRGPGLLGGRK